MKWLSRFLPRKRIPKAPVSPADRESTLAWASLQKTLVLADRAVQDRIASVIVHSSALRLAVDLDDQRFPLRGVVENKDRSTSILFSHTVELHLVLRGLGRCDTIDKLLTRPGVKTYLVDINSWTLLLRMHGRGYHIDKLILSKI